MNKAKTNISKDIPMDCKAITPLKTLTSVKQISLMEILKIVEIIFLHWKTLKANIANLKYKKLNGKYKMMITWMI